MLSPCLPAAPLLCFPPLPPRRRIASNISPARMPQRCLNCCRATTAPITARCSKRSMRATGTGSKSCWPGATAGRCMAPRWRPIISIRKARGSNCPGSRRGWPAIRGSRRPKRSSGWARPGASRIRPACPARAIWYASPARASACARARLPMGRCPKASVQRFSSASPMTIPTARGCCSTGSTPRSARRRAPNGAIAWRGAITSRTRMRRPGRWRTLRVTMAAGHGLPRAIGPQGSRRGGWAIATRQPKPSSAVPQDRPIPILPLPRITGPAAR